MAILKDRVGAGIQDMGIKRWSTHEGTAVGRREATDGEMDQTVNRVGSSVWL